MYGLEHSRYYIAVVVGTEVDKLNGGFEIVEKAVDVGQQDLDVTSCPEEVRDLYNGNKVAAVRSTGGSSP